MGFHEDAIFPSKIAVDSTFGWGFLTTILESSSGAEQRVSRRDTVRHTGDVGTGIQDPAELLELKAFHLARRGALYGFRFKDPLDHLSTDEDPCDPLTEISELDQVIGSGDDSNRSFQLQKRYENANEVYLRKITKPIDGTVLIAVDGTLLPTNEYTVDHSTGIVEITSVSPPASGTGNITAGFEFHTPVRFDSDSDRAIEVAFQEYKYGRIPKIGITEIMDSGEAPEEFWYGGSAEVDDNGGTALVSAGQGRFWKIGEGNNVVDTVKLPDAATLPDGGPHFYILNNSSGPGSGFDIVDDSQTVLVDNSVALPGTLWIAMLYYNQTQGRNIWVLVQG